MRKRSPSNIDEQRRHIIGSGLVTLGITSVIGIPAPVFANTQQSPDRSAQGNFSRLTKAQMASLPIDAPTFTVETPQGETITLKRQLRVARRYQNLMYLSYENECLIRVYDLASLQPRFDVLLSDQFGTVKDFAVSEDGNLFVLFNGRHSITQFSSNGSFVRAIGQFGLDEPSQLNGPNSLTIDSFGHIHVWDLGAQKIKVFTRKNQFLRQYGQTRLSKLQSVKSIDGREVLVVKGGMHEDREWYFTPDGKVSSPI